MKTTRIVSILVCSFIFVSFAAYADYYQKICIYNNTSQGASYELFLNDEKIKENAIFSGGNDCEWGHNEATRFLVKVRIFEEGEKYIDTYYTEIGVDAKKGTIKLEEHKDDRGCTQYKACSWHDDGSLETCQTLK